MNVRNRDTLSYVFSPWFPLSFLPVLLLLLLLLPFYGLYTGQPAFSALMLLVGWQERHPAGKKYGEMEVGTA